MILIDFLGIFFVREDESVVDQWSVDPAVFSAAW
jgi:hypothetical protein